MLAVCCVGKRAVMSKSPEEVAGFWHHSSATLGCHRRFGNSDDNYPVDSELGSHNGEGVCGAVFGRALSHL